MSKVLLLKSIFFFTFFVNLTNFAISQDSFSLRGQFLLDKKVVIGAVVTVFDGKEIVTQTATNSIGKFWINLSLQKKYVLQFKKQGIPTQKVVISTSVEEMKGDYLKSKVVVFSLSSTKQSKEGPGTDDVVASFMVNKNGILERDHPEIPEVAEVKDDKIVKVEEVINDLENKTNEIITTQIPEDEKEVQLADYNLLKRKKDSIIYWAERKAELIINDALKESDEITKEAARNASKTAAAKKNDLKSETKIKEDLKELAIEEKPFLERQDIKSYRAKLDELNKKQNLSGKDSIIYLETSILFKDEMVKSARLQLEIDKLSAKTREDSLALQQRENEILMAEQEIEDAKGQIEVQKLVIRQKNTILFFTIIALLFFVLLSVMVYRSFRNKKRTNAILEKNNIEIAKKNKKILDSIRYAQTIQQAILPIKSTIDKHFDWFIIFQPKDIVSGDFYWFNHFEETGKSVFAVVDCTGHGVPGAFMSMIGNRLLIDAVKEKEIVKPIEILEEIDARLRIALMQDQTANNDGMDICVCTIDYLENNKCRIDFAGAKRPLFYSDGMDGEMKYLKGTVRGIGGKKRLRERAVKPFEENTLILERGEMLYLTTDGFFDLISPKGKKFGRVNFMDLLEEHYKKSLPEQREAIMDALQIHKGSEFQIDDITILGVKL